MKKLLIIAFSTVALSVNAQVKKAAEAVKSNIENFSEQSGTFSKKENTLIGKVSGVEVEVVRITDIATGKVVSGVRLSGKGSGSYSSEKTAFLDADEIDSFIKVCQYVSTKVFGTDLPSNSVEYNFRARGGFSGGAFNDKKEWSGYVKLEKYDSNSYFFMNKDSFAELANLITTGKSKI